MKTVILKLLFAAWIVIWGYFILREIFIKDNLRDYRTLTGLSLEGKHARVTGERLYDFLLFCKGAIPEGASYSLSGVEDGSLEQRRSAYYLYPMIPKGPAEYMLVFGKDPANLEGYVAYSDAPGLGHILKRAPTR